MAPSSSSATRSASPVAWAVAAYELGWPGYAGVAVFIAILLAALVYELGTGALDWGLKKRMGTRRPGYAARGARS